MGKTFLLTGARAPVTLDLARALRRAGHRVIGAESLSHALSRRSRAFSAFYSIPAPNSDAKGFRSALMDVMNRERVDVLLPTCEEAFHVARDRQAFPAHVRVWVDESEKLQRLHSKVEFNAWAAAAGLPVPATTRATGVLELRRAISTIPGSQIVLKPEYSRFATRTRIGHKEDVLRDLTDAQDSIAWTVQEYLPGTEYCTYSFAQNGRLMAHLTYSHEFTAGKGAGICFEAIQHPAIEAWVRRFVEFTGFSGQIAFDFIEDSQGVVRALECNPRATSGLHLLAQNVDFLRVLCGEEVREKPVQPAPGTAGQIRLAMLAYGLPSIRSWSRAIQWLRIFQKSREVVFDPADPLPFFDQFLSFYYLIRDGRRSALTPLEVSTRDIEWNGP